MYCAECGKLIPEGASFCPNCGRMVDQSSVGTISSTQTVTSSESYSYARPIRSKNHTGKVVAVVIVALLITLAVFPGNEDEEKGHLGGQSFYGSFDGNAVLESGGMYALTDLAGFDQEEAEIFFTEFDIEPTDPEEETHFDHAVRLTLSESISSHYSHFTFLIPDREPLTKTDPFVTFYKSILGTYDVTVVCRNSPEGEALAAYSFSFAVKFHCPFFWNYDGGHFGFETFVDKVTYLTYAGGSAERAVKDYTLVPSFVQIDPTVEFITEQLKNLCSEAYGPEYTDLQLADFILAYVQCAFGYVSDSVLYKQNEYFAYPVETIVYAMGDCEDTSILCAALFKAAGFHSAVLLLPNHAMAGVADVGIGYGPGDGYEILGQTVGGRTYYACETTLDSFQKVGVSSTSGKTYSKYLNKGLTGYGSYTFYTCGEE